MSQIEAKLIVGVDWPLVFYVALFLLCCGFLRLFGINVIEVPEAIFREMRELARSIRTRESLNALTLGLLAVLIMMFFGSYIAHEMSDVIAIFIKGASRADQNAAIGFSAVLIFAVTGALSILSTR